MIIRHVGLGLTLLVLLGVAGSPLAWAERDHRRLHRHSGFSVFFGNPWPGYYRAYPPYFDSPVVVVPVAPPVYIEKEPDAAAPASAYWYFCRSPQGYYPYVKECPSGWQAVAPQPPPPSQ